jgi:hypothetical protein
MAMRQLSVVPEDEDLALSVVCPCRLRVRRAREGGIPLGWMPPLLPFEVVQESNLFCGLVAEACARQIRPTLRALELVHLGGAAVRVRRAVEFLDAIAEARA